MDGRGTSIRMCEVDPVRNIGSRATHGCMEAGGRVTQDAVAEDAKAEAGIQFLIRFSFPGE